MSQPRKAAKVLEVYARALELRSPGVSAGAPLRVVFQATLAVAILAPRRGASRAAGPTRSLSGVRCDPPQWGPGAPYAPLRGSAGTTVGVRPTA